MFTNKIINSARTIMPPVALRKLKPCCFRVENRGDSNSASPVTVEEDIRTKCASVCGCNMLAKTLRCAAKKVAIRAFFNHPAIVPQHL